MSRNKILQIAATVVVLAALGVWSYSSGTTKKSSLARSSTTTTVKKRKTTSHTSKPTAPVATTGGASTTTIEANPEAYATALYRYWTQRDRDSAAKIATADVVTKLFKSVWHQSAGWSAKGCIGTTATTSCTWARPRRALVLQIRNATGTLPVLVVSARFVVVK